MEMKALLIISFAREEGLIKKSNLRKLDRNIDEMVSQDLQIVRPNMRLTLPEEIQLGVDSQRRQRDHLPQPEGAQHFHAPRSQPLEVTARLNEVERFSALPEELKEE